MVSEWSTISDSHHYCLVVRKIPHAKPCVERISAMRCGELLHVVDLTVGRAPAMIRDAIPARFPCFVRSDARNFCNFHTACATTRKKDCEHKRCCCEPHVHWSFLHL